MLTGRGPLALGARLAIGLLAALYFWNLKIVSDTLFLQGNGDRFSFATIHIMPMHNGTERDPVEADIIVDQSLNDAMLNSIDNTLMPLEYRVGSPLVVYAAGDICAKSRSSPGCADTAAIISQDQSPNVHVLPLGDLAYDSGTIGEFHQNYETYWGPFKNKTYPVPGNHEKMNGYTGYYAYWGRNGTRSTKPGRQGEGFYSYDLGTSWHFVALNTNDWDSTQSDWLKNDLAANSRPCTLVYGHHPRYSPGMYGPHGPLGVPWMMKEVSQILSDNRADIYLSGHEHIYARYAKQDANGTADAMGTAFIVVGTGGFNTQRVYNQTMANMEAWFTADPNKVSSSGPYGLLRLELRDGDYDVSYLVTEGGFMDSQTATSCNRGLYA